MSHKGLEPYLITPKGGKAARCQAINRNGQQCNNPARKGFKACWQHGAGSSKREREGRAKPAGRPLVTGIYSVRQRARIQEMLEQAMQFEHDLDNTDREIVLSRVLLQQALTLEPDIVELRAALQQAIDDGAYKGPELLQAARTYERLERYLHALSELNRHVVHIAKARAEIIAKTAQAKALEQFAAWTQTLKGVLAESLDREQYEAIAVRLEREVLGPLGLNNGNDN